MGFREDFLWGGAVAAHQCEVLGKKVEKESAVAMSKLQEITLQVRQDV